jgi:hypothetical protein
MKDTIELLEAIGQDASLRHASAEELAHVLAQARASEALTAAVTQGDRSLLAAELGHAPNEAPQVIQTPGTEEEPEQEDEEEQLAPSSLGK